MAEKTQEVCHFALKCVQETSFDKATFDILFSGPLLFLLVPASYFILDTSNGDDGLHVRQSRIGNGPPQYDCPQEAGCLSGMGETGRGLAGTWTVVHLEKNQGAGTHGDIIEHAGKKTISTCTVPFSLMI